MLMFRILPSPQKIEINATHPLIVRLASARDAQPELAKSVAQQLVDNALISAGLLDDPRTVVANITSIMTEALKHHAPAAKADVSTADVGEQASGEEKKSSA